VESLAEPDITSTGVFSICAWFLFPVLLCWGEFCCVVSVLHCVAIRCIAAVLYLLSCVALWSVVLRCLVLCCIVDKFSISSIPSILKLYISYIVNILNQLHSLADNLYTRELKKTQPHLPNRWTQHLSLTLRQYEPHYVTNSTNSTTLTHWQTKSPHLNTTRQTKRPLSNLTYFNEPTMWPTRQSRLIVTRWGRLKLHTSTQLLTK